MKRLKQLYIPIAAAVLLLFAGACSVSVTTIGNQETAAPQKAVQAQKAVETPIVKAGKFDGGRMWTFDDPPVQYFEETYGFRPDDGWLEHARLGSLRFATWCSASFVSRDGLVMTNHHCARTSEEKVQKEGEKLLENGFYAFRQEDERRVPDLFVEQLIEIRDITSDIRAAMDKESADAAKVNARDAAITEIQKKLSNGEGIRCQVISLYHGGKYSAYIFKRYNDVRLVFAPELTMGHFGGEDDNFTYPRYAIDCSFFRVYGDDGKPVNSETYFKWSENGAKENDLVFVLGNPGSTNRLATYAQLEFFRDFQYPFISRLISDRMNVLQTYAGNDPVKKAEVHTDILGMANGAKSYEGRLDGLHDEILMARRRDFERQFKSAVQAKPELNARYGFLWDKIAQDRTTAREIAPKVYGLRTGGLGTSAYLTSAVNAVRFHLTREKNGKQSDAVDPKDARKIAPFIDAKKEIETLTLARHLEMMRDYLGNDDPIVVSAFGGKTAKDAARELIAQTAMKDSAAFYTLVSGGMSALKASNDRFIKLALAIVPRQDEANAAFGEISNRDQVNIGLLGRALYEVYGTSVPPDATFSLRLADGVVKGYRYNGTKAPVNTTFHGMYDRYYSFPGEEGWAMPDRWKNPPAEFNMATPCNFVSTCDIIGGNSGSPIVNKNLEVVGLVFDGNIESLPGDYIFAEDRGNRTVSVHSSGILEMLRHIYKATRIADELKQGKAVQ